MPKYGKDILILNSKELHTKTVIFIIINKSVNIEY